MTLATKLDRPSSPPFGSETEATIVSTDAYAVLDRPAFKNEVLGLWLFAYIGLLDTMCTDVLPVLRRRSMGDAEMEFVGLGGRITLDLRVETDAAGAAIDFGVSTLMAVPRLPSLSHLRFDLDETDNPLIALTHTLLLIVELKRAPILAALNGASAPSS